MVGGVVFEAARAEQPCVAGIGALVEDRLGAPDDGGSVGRDDLVRRAGQGLVEVDVGPGPEVVGGREEFRVGDRDVGEGPPDHVFPVFELALGEHDEGEPWAQPQVAAVGRGRRVPPEEVLVVEVDRRQVVRLEVRDPVARLRPQDRPLVDSHQVAGPVEGDVLFEVVSERFAAGHGSAAQFEFDLRGGAGRHFGVFVGGGDHVRDAAAVPGQEAVGRQPAHAATSKLDITCRVPAREGSEATVAWR